MPAFFWKNEEAFLEHGFGYMAFDANDYAAVAFSAAVSSSEVDIGVETVEGYRGQGLAKKLADRMCREIIKMGKSPVWAHSLSNEGSGATALSVGFKLNKINAVIKKENI